MVAGRHFRDVVLPAFARCAVLHGSVTRRVARMPTADIRQTNGYATRRATAAQRRADNKSEETDGRVLPLNYPAIVQQGQDSNLRHDPGML